MENKYIAKKINGKKFDEHRLVYEKHWNIKLSPKNVIHHIDVNKSNNSIDNLMFFKDKSEHTRFHRDKGDLYIINGNNKKILIDGKLKCAQCNIMKYLHEFQKRKTAHLGVVGVCKICRREEVKRYKLRKMQRSLKVKA